MHSSADHPRSLRKKKPCVLRAGQKKRLAAIRASAALPSAMAFADLSGEAIMLIARFTPHPCAEIMEDCEDAWFFGWRIDLGVWRWPRYEPDDEPDEAN